MRDCWYVRARPASRAVPRGHGRHVGAEQLDRAGRRWEVSGDDVEERRLAGAVRAENGSSLAVGDLEIDVGDRDEAAEPPADPPQAEGRLGVFGAGAASVTAYLITGFVMTPFLTTLSFPCHGVFVFLHGGWERPGGGLDGLKRPPNDWSTLGT